MVSRSERSLGGVEVVLGIETSGGIESSEEEGMEMFLIFSREETCVKCGIV